MHKMYSIYIYTSIKANVDLLFILLEKIHYSTDVFSTCLFFLSSASVLRENPVL